ncbi:MAG: hypothetical protein IMZ62_11810, partial [Chloroflexi bacterium]|nr:hypothetical protein [Chloroflexota bacterium]
LTNCWGQGKLNIVVVAGTASDAGGGLANGVTSAKVTVDAVPPTGSVVINGGASWTKVTNVTLTCTYSDGSGSGVTQMRFSNNGTAWGDWITAAASATWTLAAGDGTKTVYAQYKDAAGNESQSASDTIMLDATPPSGTVTINGGAAFTNSLNVSLALTYGDGTGSGVTQMRFSNDGAAWSNWETAGASKTWTLVSGDGTKTVYAQFRDAVENISANATDTIALDTSAPTGTVSINSGAGWTNSRDVTLTLSSSDTGSGVEKMRFSNDGTSWSAWENYATSKAWTLSTGDGLKTVYAQFRDQAQNVSANATDTISLDTTAPSGSIVINGGAAYTNNRNVTLTLAANDATGSGVADMRLSDDGTSWDVWTAFATSKPRTVASGDGLKRVYAQFRDVLGNISPTLSDGITLDTVAPTGTVVIKGGDAFATSIEVPLALAAQDAGSGVGKMRFSNTASEWSEWENFAVSKTWPLIPGDGLKTVYVQFLDNAGNSSPTVSDDILLDTTAPTGSFTINGGAAYTNSQEVSLAIEATDSGSGLVSMRVSNNGSSWVWEDFAETRAWTLTAADGLKTVYMAFRDDAGNFSVPVTRTIIVDTTPPEVTLTTPSTRVTGPFVVTATFTDPVTGFEAADVAVTDGTVSAFAGTDNSYSWTVTPTNALPISVSIPADVCENPVNLLNVASNTLEITPIGSLTVTIAPAYAAEQARWRVNGADYHSGETVQLDPGEYQV